MISARAICPAGGWSGAPADCVVLDYDERHRRRVAMTGVRGLDFLLDLPEAVMLRSGDGLVLEDGRIVEVVAAPEPLAEIRAADAAALARVAWHLGNRHLPTEMTKRALRIRRDHVIEEMVRGLGAEIREIEAPFNPEGGAYASAADHGHGAHDHHPPHHDHDHGHDHAHEQRDAHRETHHDRHEKHDHGHGHRHGSEE
ncbi:MAG TPA: urease accessory protein UreE [Roseiarcus sp.]|nr:urease accessory protein UreE [Roseiarcus sp.]